MATMELPKSNREKAKVVTSTSPNSDGNFGRTRSVFPRKSNGSSSLFVMLLLLASLLSIDASVSGSGSVSPTVPSASVKLKLVKGQPEEDEAHSDVASPRLSVDVQDDTNFSQAEKESNNKPAWIREQLIARFNRVDSGRRLADLVRISKRNSITDGEASKKGDPFPANPLILGFASNGIQPLDSEHYSKPKLWQLVLRASKLSFVFFPVWSTAGLAYISGLFRRRIWYKWLALCLGQSGPAGIKWGQWSSTRSDMFPLSLCQALSTLHAQAPSHKPSWSHKTLATALGITDDDLQYKGKGKIAEMADIVRNVILDDFEDEPIASGSIAQIHRATIDGHKVAIKIRHPGVAEKMATDFALMEGLVSNRLIDFLLVKFGLVQLRETVEQFSKTLIAQANLHVEAIHLDRLNTNFAHWPSVQFPKPIWASPSAIIETFEQGQISTDIIDSYDAKAEAITIEQSGHERKKVIEKETYVEGDDSQLGIIESSEKMAKSLISPIETVDEGDPVVHGYDIMPLDIAEFLVTEGLSLYLKMLLVDNLMHADLHPGNIMIDGHGDLKAGGMQTTRFGDDSTSRTCRDYRITLVDAGMVAELTEEESGNFIGLLVCLGEGNGYQAGKFALKFSFENESKMAVECEAFCLDMEDLFENVCRGYGTRTNVGEVLRGVLVLIQKHRVRIGANYATLVINILCLESIAARSCPSYNLLDSAQPILQGFRRLCFTPEYKLRPERRNSLIVRAMLGMKYWHKARRDQKFFRRARQLRNTHSNPTL